MDLFNKSISDIEKDDIEWIIEEQLPEDERLEFKKTLPGRDDEVDSWINGDSSVDRYAINKVIKEVIAFSNADGGYVIVGVDENRNVKPRKAKEINKIPNIGLLADKFKMYLRDYIEPTINNVLCRGIEFDEDGNGVLIIFADKSNFAPHRSKIDNHCYIRRNDRSEKLTMREIRDLILLRQRSIEEVNEEFERRKHKFLEKFESGEIPYRFNQELDDERLGFRVTFIPTTNSILLRNIYNKIEWKIFESTLYLTFDSGDPKEQEMTFPFSIRNKFPIIRGVQFYGTQLNIEITEDGIIDLYLVIENKAGGYDQPHLHIEWFVAAIYRGILGVESIKSLTSVYNVEYGIEIGINSTANQFLPLIFENKVRSPKGISTPIHFPRSPSDLV